MNTSSLLEFPVRLPIVTPPIEDFQNKLLAQQSVIENWFYESFANAKPSLFASVDIRNAGFKMCPVDTNLFPAGFNNIDTKFSALSVKSIQKYLNALYPGISKILIVPENHTRNRFYFENLAQLQGLMSQAGFQVHIGSFVFQEMTKINLSEHSVLTLYPIRRVGNKLETEVCVPDLICLNNDLSEGVPEILQHLSQPITPSLELGWLTRLKTNHFYHYKEVVNNFADLLGVDPWAIFPEFIECDSVDILSGDADHLLLEKAESLIAIIEKKYDQYGIKQTPFLFLKADQGTYGMGVHMLQDPKEIMTLNRKQRTKLTAAKGNRKVTRYILQEGVPSFECYGQEKLVAEPVLYLIGENPIGGFYRVHKKKSPMENLNSPGMHFEPLAFHEACLDPHHDLSHNDTNQCFYVYGVIARLAQLAAAQELKEVTKDLEK